MAEPVVSFAFVGTQKIKVGFVGWVTKTVDGKTSDVEVRVIKKEWPVRPGDNATHHEEPLITTFAELGAKSVVTHYFSGVMEKKQRKAVCITERRSAWEVLEILKEEGALPQVTQEETE